MHSLSRPAGLTTVAALALGLTACGTSEPPAPAKAGEPAPQTVEYLSQWNPQDPEAQVFNAAIEAFQKANPTITVKATYAGRNNDAKILNQIKAGDAPDLIEGGTARLKQFKLEPLDDLYAMKVSGEDKTVAEVIPSGLKALNAAEGKAYALPYEYVVQGLWFDDKQLTSRNLTAPTTWDELMAQVPVLAKAGVAPFQQDGSVAGYNFFWFADLVTRNVGQEGIAAAAKDRTGQTWLGEGYNKAAQQLLDLVKAGGFQPGYEGTTFPAGQNAWAKGKGVYALNFSWMPKETDKVRPDGFTMRFVPFPNVGGPGDGIVEADTTSWVIPEAAKDKDGAKKFLAFLYGKQWMQQLSDTAKTLTPRTDVTPPALMADVTKLLATDPKVMPRLGDLERNAPADYEAKVIDPVFGAFFKSVGKQTAEDFVAKLAGESKKYWDQQD
ncbi:ABC transporter substrate-binding protein [Nonomuraea sp. NPDC050556]|uniref:ABC transporter substrate-binding protein n=1 Tax=Nonomuraea sp. NPDC050556 TaxID=3364369 RepID=UPI00378FDA66